MFLHWCYSWPQRLMHQGSQFSPPFLCKLCRLLLQCFSWTLGSTLCIATCIITSFCTATSTLSITGWLSPMQLGPFTIIRLKDSCWTLLVGQSLFLSQGWLHEQLFFSSALLLLKLLMITVVFGCLAIFSILSSRTTVLIMTSIINSKDLSTTTLNLSFPYGINFLERTCHTI